MALVHLASRLYGTPLLIAQSKLEVILAVLGPRIGLSEIALATQPPVSRNPGNATTPGIAVIPIHGTLVRRTMGIDALSGLTSYVDLADQMDAALGSPQVQGILLEVDSPGGEAGGVFELAARIRSANSIKPIWAHANDAAYSAAYGLASGASRLTLSQTAGVGSIGVIALHVDQSVKDARDGLSYQAIYAGHHKNDFSPHAPLSPQATASLQIEVDRLYEVFVETVAKMRGLDPQAVRDTEAGLLFGKDAIASGLADDACSLDTVLTEFSQFLTAQRRLTLGGPRAAVITPTPSTLNEPDPISTDTEEPAMTTPTTPVSPVAPPAAPPLPAPPLPEAPAAVSTSPGTQAFTRNDAHAIAEMCLLAGVPQRTTEFLASGLSLDNVRQTLLASRAQQPDIQSQITTDVNPSAPPANNLVLAAMKKLINRG